MIEGLKIIIPGAKVAALAAKRALHHKEKVKQYNDAKTSVAAAKAGKDGPNTYEWDEGVAP